MTNDKRLDWLQAQPDGCLLFKPSGVHFVMVEKSQSVIRVALIDRDYLTSDLVQSQLDFNEPLNLISLYSQAMLLSLVWQPQPKRVYCAGFGGGRIPSVLHHYFPHVQIECTEIEPLFIEIATEFFGVPFDERLKVALQDGRDYLAKQEPDVCYDIIFTDAIIGNGYTPYRLATQEFYQLCQNHLSENGVLAVNLFQRERFYADKVKTIQAVFAQIYLFPLDVGNTVVLATNSPPLNLPEILERIQVLQNDHQFAFPLSETAVQVKIGSRLIECIPQLDRAKVLVDAEPPVGYFDDLPSFNPLFAQGISDRPCPCGSGQLFQACHGRLNANCQPSTVETSESSS